MTFNLLLLNEFPDEEADRAGGRKNLVLMLGRKDAALVSRRGGRADARRRSSRPSRSGAPAQRARGGRPSSLLAKPLAWAFDDTREPVPIPALGANVAWNLATNTVLAAALAVAVAMR